jgi:DNA-binding GntR family transcriptional regulator
MDDIDLSNALGGSASRRLAARQPLVDDVYDVLVDMLMNHTLSPGARLNIDALARTLGVSPTPVREALARAEATGLVVKERNRGYAVAPLIGLDELHALMDFRLLVEPHAAGQAACPATRGCASRWLACRATCTCTASTTMPARRRPPSRSTCASPRPSWRATRMRLAGR